MSEFTDKVDSDRREDIHFNTWVASCKVELTGFEGRKKEIVIEGKEKLEARGYDKEKISATLGDKFEGYISRQYIRRVLGDEFKDISKRNIEKEEEGCETVSHTSPELEQSERIMLTTDGQSIRENSSSDDEIDSIYNKNFNQMKKEADREIAEDKEETLENPQNRVPLISDIPPEIREKLARFDEMEDMVRQMAEDRDTAISQARVWSKKFNQLKGGSVTEELQRLKVENTNLNLILADIDREALQSDQGYKEVEVFKIEPGTTRLLNEISNKAQRTFFLLVNPKTMQIKGARTDVQQHQIDAKRKAGVS